MTEKFSRPAVLIGNAFPLSLMRSARITVESMSVADLHAALADAPVASFWGHENTRPAAESVLGVSLVPKTPRPALVLDADNYPSLDGRSFRICWVLSPDYRPGFRPAIGEEVAADAIKGWHVLKLTWQ